MTIKTAAILAGLCLLAAPAVAEQKVKIGYINTFSGPNGNVGQEQRDGLELGLDHIGRKMAGLDVEVFYEDDQMKPEIGKQVTEKLILTKNVDFITGFTWSNVLLAALKPAVDANTFIISGNAGPSPIAGELCSPWFFAISWQGDQLAMALGEALNRRGVKKLFLLAPNYAAGKDMAAGVKRSFQGEVVGEEYTRWPGQLEFSTELTKIRAAKPDAVWVFYPGAGGSQFFQQFAQAGLKDKIPVFSISTTDGLTLEHIRDLALGSLSTRTWVEDLDNPVNKQFVADFRKRFGRHPSYYAAQAYDSVMMMNAGVKGAGGDLSKKDTIRAAMRKADFPTTRGKLAFGNNHFPIQNFYLQEVIADGEGGFTFKTVETVFANHQDAYHQNCPMTW